MDIGYSTDLTSHGSGILAVPVQGLLVMEYTSIYPLAVIKHGTWTPQKNTCFNEKII